MPAPRHRGEPAHARRPAGDSDDNLLIVDDEPLRALISPCCASSRTCVAVVGEADSGLAAITAAEQLHPDVIFARYAAARHDGPGSAARGTPHRGAARHHGDDVPRTGSAAPRDRRHRLSRQANPHRAVYRVVRARAPLLPLKRGTSGAEHRPPDQAASCRRSERQLHVERGLLPSARRTCHRPRATRRRPNRCSSLRSARQRR